MDQATVTSGFSIFENDNLIAYGLLEVDQGKNYLERIKDMCILIKQKIIEYKPNVIIFEDCQFQHNYQTYKQLSQLQGSIMNILYELDLPFHIVEPTKWRKNCGIKGRKRMEQKVNTQLFVESTYGIKVSEDIADSIGIGHYAVSQLNSLVAM